MADLTNDQQAALSVAQAVLNETSNPVVVRYVAGGEAISDTRFLLVLFDAKGFLFDRTRGTTHTIDLAQPSVQDPHAGILDRAKIAAHRAGLNVVYFIRR